MTINLATIVRDAAARWPDRTAIVSGDLELTHASLLSQARRFAGGLSRIGVKRGDHVALLLPNVASFPIAYFAAHYLGAPVVPLNPLLTPDEILYHLEDSDSVALVAAPSCLDRARTAAGRAAARPAIILAAEGPPEARAPRGCHSMTALAASSPPASDPVGTMPDETAVILYTSGTTGRPKGAELTHFNLHENADCFGRALSLDADTKGLCALPLFHSFGQTALQNAVLMRGGAILLMLRFEAGTALGLIDRHGVTYFAGVPTMYFELLQKEQPGPRPLRGLRTCVCGGAPMPVEVMREFDRRHDTSILESYGLSETSPVATINPPDRPKRAGSIGLPLDGVELKLIDAAGREIAQTGVTGELCIKGPNVMKGYYKRPEATAEAIPDGWLRTGDVARRDADGYYYIVDRLKDLIIRGGFNVYPREVEEVLYAHPAVAEAAVVGTPDARSGEEIKAAVILAAGAEATAEEIIAHCRERLAAYKCPRVVQFLDALPKGPSGKILRRQLRG